MRKHNKTVCFILVTIMVFSTVAFSAEEPFYDVQSENVKTAIHLLNDLGIVETYKDGSFRGYEKVTRKEFAKIICEFLAFENVISSGNSYFIDVTAEMKEYDYIQTVASLNIMKGMGDGTFKPNEYLTNGQVIMTLVNILGYRVLAEQYGTSQNGYLNAASQIGLNLKGVADDYATKENIVLMIYDACDIEILQQVSFGKEARFNTEKSNTILSVYHDIYKDTGIVDANYLTTLNSAKKIKTNEVMISGVKYESNIEDIGKYLGYSVEFYAKGKDDNYEVISISKKRQNTVLEINYIDVKSAMDKTTLEYYEDDKLKKVQISPIADFIYNGVAYTEFTEADYFLDCGTLTLIDNNDDGVYEVIFVDSYEVVIADVISETNKTVKNIYIKGDKTLECLELTKDEFDVIEITKNGVVATFGDITQGSVLMVKRSKEKDYLNVDILSSTVSGIITETDVESITLDNANVYDIGYAYKYAVSQSDISALSYEVSENVIIYLNLFGEIVYMTKKNLYSYGYLMDSGATSGIDSKAEVRIFTEDEVWKNFICTDTVKIDGKLAKSVSDILDVETKQLVRYKVNSNGNVYEIETSKIYSDSEKESAICENKFRNYLKGNRIYRYQNKSWDSAVYMNDSTKVLMIPTNEPYASEEDYYYYTTAGALLADVRYDVTIYDYDSDEFVNFMVIRQSFSADTNIQTGPLFLVDNISYVMVKDEALQKVKGVYGGRKVSYIGASDSIFNGVQKGDVIQIQTNPNGRIDYYSIIYSIASGRATTAVSVTDFHQERLILKANVTKLSSKIMHLSSDGGNYVMRLQGSAYIYDTKRGIAETASFNDIKEGDFIIMRVRQSTTGETIVIR